MRLLLLFIILFSSLSLKAEYSACFVEVEVETTSGEKIHGYQMLSGMCNEVLASADISTYLRGGLSNGFDSVSIYSNRLSYRYINPYDSSSKTREIYIYKHINLLKIPLAKVKNVKLLSTVEGGYSCWIENDLTLKDTLWMAKPFVTYYSINGYLCDYQIYIHLNSAGVTELINELKAVQKKHQAKLQQMEEKGEEPAPEDEIAIDRELENVIKKYNTRQLKMIIHECCSC